MQLQNPIGVVTPTLDAPVLAVLARAEQAFSGRQVHKLAGVGSEQAVRNALERQVEQGVVVRSQAGAAYLYQLNREHLAAPHLIGLATLQDDLFQRWRALIGQWPVQPRVVMLFGSAARGEMRPKSDIDLLVVTDDEEDDRFDELIRALQTTTTGWTGNDTRVLQVRPSQVTLKEPALAAAADEGVTVVGDRTWLSRTLRRRSSVVG